MIDKRLRDLFWLAILALVLAAWGWDRGRLATRLEALNAPTKPAIPLPQTFTVDIGLSR